MKTTKERILTIALITTFALAFLGYMLIRGAWKHFNNPVSYFMLGLGIVLIVLFLTVLLIVIRYAKKKERVEQVEKENKLPSWTKIPVDLDTVQIKSNKWNSSRFIPTNFYDIELKEENILTLLEFEIEIDGQQKKYYWPSDREPKSLEMYFALQKKTDLYLNPSDPSEFYLDLRFIP